MKFKEPSNPAANSEEDRREFLRSCGRFAVSTPPLVTMLLSTSLTSNAIAKSGSGRRQGQRPQPGRTPAGRDEAATSA